MSRVQLVASQPSGSKLTFNSPRPYSSNSCRATIPLLHLHSQIITVLFVDQTSTDAHERYRYSMMSLVYVVRDSSIFIDPPVDLRLNTIQPIPPTFKVLAPMVQVYLMQRYTLNARVNSPLFAHCMRFLYTLLTHIDSDLPLALILENNSLLDNASHASHNSSLRVRKFPDTFIYSFADVTFIFNIRNREFHF